MVNPDWRWQILNGAIRKFSGQQSTGSCTWYFQKKTFHCPCAEIEGRLGGKRKRVKGKGSRVPLSGQDIQDRSAQVHLPPSSLLTWNCPHHHLIPLPVTFSLSPPQLSPLGAQLSSPFLPSTGRPRQREREGGMQTRRNERIYNSVMKN